MDYSSFPSRQISFKEENWNIFFSSIVFPLEKNCSRVEYQGIFFLKIIIVKSTKKMVLVT